MNKKIYFVSDAHLGIPNQQSSLVREKRLVAWLEEVSKDAEEIYFLGDIFDFWFDYRKVVPKGFVRLLGKMADLSDAGIKLHYFTGNHDMWMNSYLEEEIGLVLYKEPVHKVFNGKHFYIGHGDGLGPADAGYKFLKNIFSNRVLQFLFSWIHPDIGIALANFWSKQSRKSHAEGDKVFLGVDNEHLVLYCKEVLAKEYFDFFIFGHRHLPLIIDLDKSSRYYNTGDWYHHYSYLEFSGDALEQKFFIQS